MERTRSSQAGGVVNPPSWDDALELVPQVMPNPANDCGTM
jgi:hypothetical protein